MTRNIRSSRGGETTPLTYTTRSSFLRRVQSGDEKAWNEFFERYAGMIRAIGAKRNLSPEECDDLLIEVMTIFWRKMDSFVYDRRKGKFRAYLSRIASFAARGIRRRGGAAAAAMPEVEAEYPAEIDRACMEEWCDYLLKSALEDLKDCVDTEIWQVFYMLEIQRRPVAEIAKIMRRTAGSIYTIRHRCLQKLRAIIDAYRERGDAELARHSHRNSGAN